MTDTFRPLGEITSSIVDKLALGAVDRIPVTDRESWLRLRMGDVTASDIASICGVGYRSALAVWAEKRGLISGTADNAILRRGRWFEPAIWTAVKDENPSWEIRAAKVYLRSPLLRMGATPDALAIDPDRKGVVLLQGKIVSKPVFNRDWIVDNTGADPVVPIGYQLQTLAETMLAEAAYGEAIHPVLAALVVDTFSAELHLIPVQRHPDAEAKILATVKSFWVDFDAGREPAVDPAKDHDVVKKLWAHDNGATIDLSSNNALPALMDERKILTDEIKIREDRKKQIETEVKGKIGEASYALIAGGRKLSLKLTARAGYEVKPTEFRSLREIKVR